MSTTECNYPVCDNSPIWKYTFYDNTDDEEGRIRVAFLCNIHIDLWESTDFFIEHKKVKKKE